MPIKKDGGGNRWVEMEIVVPGTPDQVWHAMATGPGNTAWFTKTTVDGRVGGEIRFDFGPNGGSTGEITEWDPPSRFGYVERNWNEGAPPVATEITIAERSADSCLVRMVHTLSSSSDEWDSQLEGFEKGWQSFFDVLRLYLKHFAGQPAASFMAIASVAGDPLQAWKRLAGELGVAGADAGDRCTVSAPEPLGGVVETVRQNDQERVVVIRIDDPGPGCLLAGTFLIGPAVHASSSLYFYGQDAGARAAAIEPRWRDWLAGRFPQA